ncbi:uncharacterized protein LOC130710666 [Lotus japonicus]|uniref:uncharacterized protein LOC130710666 n=1 Tax=Lotus japonicus TaxID=34305 RepID=UPI00258ACD8C|nr:uncharacterized protein LOC130710666 [Lotus japonicus]
MKTQTTFGHDKPFGGKVVVLGGNFRQILPVILKGNRSDIVASAMNSSYLWKYCKVMKLTTNMRLQHAASSSSAKEIKEFTYWILQVGDGTVKTIDDDDSIFEIPSDLLVKECENPLLELVNFAYPNIAANLENQYFEQRALLAPTLESVEEVNNLMLSSWRGDRIFELRYSM